MKKLSPRQCAVVLYELTRDVGKDELEKAVGLFVVWLKKAQLLKKASAIISAFEIYANSAAGVHHITMTTARHLEKKEVDAVAAIFGKQVEVNAITDPHLIGGVIVHDQNIIFDGSIRKQLQILHQHLS